MSLATPSHHGGMLKMCGNHTIDLSGFKAAINGNAIAREHSQSNRCIVRIEISQYTQFVQ